MNWATRKKLIYFGVLVAFLGLVVFPLIYVFYPRPSCTDGRKNQNEEGIDCGGACEKVCTRELADVIINWQRFFKVTQGVYSAVAYVTNPNFGVAAERVSYTFKFYDDRNILVGERKGNALIPPSTSVPIFEGLIPTGSRIPSRVFFEFTEAPQWVSAQEQPVLSIKNPNLKDADKAPRLSAEIVNETIDAIRNVKVVAVVYGEDKSALAASETVLGTIDKTSSKEVIFTWPEAFARPVGSFEIYPVFLVR